MNFLGFINRKQYYQGYIGRLELREGNIVDNPCFQQCVVYKNRFGAYCAASNQIPLASQDDAYGFMELYGYSDQNYLNQDSLISISEQKAAKLLCKQTNEKQSR